MASSKKVYQVVFLIDVKSGCEEHPVTRTSDIAANKIRLTSLKLLTYFCNKNIRSKLKWGYKFYNSCSLTDAPERYTLQDLNLNTFDEYERRVESKLESERTKIASRLFDSPKSKTPTKAKTSKNFEEDDFDEFDVATPKDRLPIEVLKDAIQQLLYDFQWNAPEIGSPVRSSQRKSKKLLGRTADEDDSYTLRKNIVFILSPCPQTADQLYAYSDIHRCEPGPYFNKLMPNQLFKEFHEIKKINLHWINIGGSIDKSKDFQGIHLLDLCLKRLQGAVIPVEAVIQSLQSTQAPVVAVIQDTDKESPQSVEIASITTKSSTSADVLPGIVLPYSSVLDYYMTKYKTEEIVQQTQLCLVKDCKFQAICDLKLQSLFTSEFHSSQVPNKQKVKKTVGAHNGDQLHIHVTVNTDKGQGDTDFSVNVDDSFKPDEDSKQVQGSFKSNKEAVHESNPFPQTCIIRGTVRAGTIPLFSLDSRKSFVCSSVIKEDSNSNCSVFENMLLELSSNNLLMVLDCIDFNPLGPQTCILQPFTPVSASLTFLKAECLMDMEKALWVNQNKCDSGDDKDESLDKFIWHSVKHIGKKLDGIDGMHKEIPFTSRATQDASFYSSVLERWLVPGSKVTKTEKVLSQLQDRTSNSLSMDKMERKLQSHYRQVMEPGILTKSKPVTQSTPKKCESPVERDVLPKPRSSRSLHRITSSSQNTGRGSWMIEQSQKMLRNKKKSDENIGDNKNELVRQKKAEAKEDEKRERISKEVKKHDFASHQDLVQQLEKMYASTVQGEIAILPCAQSLVNIILHYFKTKDLDSYQEQTRQFVEDHFLKNYSDLKLEYCDGKEEDKKQREFELQVVLRVELEAALLDGDESMQDELIEEIAKILRGVSFMSGPTYLPEFLKDVLLENYVHTLPKSMGKLYEELMQEPPEEYAFIFSPRLDSSMDLSGSFNSSVAPPSTVRSVELFSVKSHTNSSVGSNSNEAWSAPATRTRSIVHHPSLSDIRPKRQIVIPAFKKPKADKHHERKSTSSSSASKRSAKKKAKQSADAENELIKVRRNLFKKALEFVGSETADKSKSEKPRLERRQSVAVMQRFSSPGKQRHAKIQRFSSPGKPRHAARKSRQSPRRRHTSGQKQIKAHHVIKTKVVAETPAHKTKLSQLLKEQREKRHQRAKTEGDVVVVGESPGKGFECVRKSPRLKAKVPLTKRASFYGKSESLISRNVEKYKQLATRFDAPCASINPKNSGGKTPRRVRTVLFSQLLTSPGTDMTTPCKMKSPSKAVQNISFDSPSRNTRSKYASPLKIGSPLIDDTAVVFDSPSRNTRSQDANSLASPLKFRSPLKNNGLSSFDSPSRNTRSHGPISTPKKSFSPLCQFDDTDSHGNVNAMSKPDLGKDDSVAKELDQVCGNQVAKSKTPRKIKTVLLQSGLEQFSEGFKTADTANLPMELPADGNILMQVADVFQESRFESDENVVKPIYSHTFTDQIPNTGTRTKNEVIPNTNNQNGEICGQEDQSCTIHNLSLKQNKPEKGVSKKRRKSATLKQEKENESKIVDNKTPRKRLQLPITTYLTPPSQSKPSLDTPSPKQSVTKVKTPEAFDTWPRKKQRRVSTNNSPSSSIKSVTSSPEKEKGAKSVTPSTTKGGARLKRSKKASKLKSKASKLKDTEKLTDFQLIHSQKLTDSQSETQSDEDVISFTKYEAKGVDLTNSETARQMLAVELEEDLALSENPEEVLEFISPNKKNMKTNFQPDQKYTMLVSPSQYGDVDDVVIISPVSSASKKSRKGVPPRDGNTNADTTETKLAQNVKTSAKKSLSMKSTIDSYCSYNHSPLCVTRGIAKETGLGPEDLHVMSTYVSPEKKCPGKNSENQTSRKRKKRKSFGESVSKRYRSQTLSNLDYSNSTQNSVASVDYFSADNDEVFLSGESTVPGKRKRITNSKQGGYGSDIESVVSSEYEQSPVFHRNSQVHFSRNSSSDLSDPNAPLHPRLASLRKLGSKGSFTRSSSDTSQKTESEYEKSPVFGATISNISNSPKGIDYSEISKFNPPVNMPSRQNSDDCSSPGRDSSDLDSNADSKTSKQFSPSVSAKSLLNLIQSPIIGSKGAKTTRASSEKNKAFPSKRTDESPTSNVSAKGLLQLITSPLVKDNTSGSENIEDDNANMCDEKIQERTVSRKSRRSLKLNNQ